MIVVEKLPDANTLEVTRAVEGAIADLAPALADMRIDATVYRPASFVESALGNIAATLLVGIVLALLVIGLFLFSWRFALIALIGVVLSIATAVVVLGLFGVTPNLVVILGLVAALAVVVADVMIDPAGIAARMRERQANGYGNGPANGAAGRRQASIVGATLAMRRPAVYALLIAALAVTPMFFVPGSAGAFVAPLGVALLVGLGSALLVALVVVPSLVAVLHGGGAERAESPAVRWLHGRWDRLGSRAMPRPRAELVAAGVLVVLGALTLPLLYTQLMPTLREPDLLVTFDGAEGAAGPEMARVTAAATAELRALPGVGEVGAHIGRAVLSDQVADVDAGEIWVRIAPDADYDATVAAVQEVVDGYPGLQRGVQTYLGERSGSLLTSPDTELLVRLYGEDSAVLDAKADEVRQMLTGVAGVQDPVVERVPLRPTLQVEVDLARAQQFSIKPGDVRRTVATLLAGLEVGSVFEAQKVFEVVVWGTPELRNSVSGVQNLLVDRPDGNGQVRVGDVADVRVAPAPAVIQRDSSTRHLDVTATVSGRDYGAVSAEVRERLSAIPFPFEHRAEIVDDYSARQDAVWRIVGVAVMALVLIYLLAQAAVRSWWLALLVVATVPVALSGAAVAALVGGRAVSLGTLVGLLAVVAVALRLTLWQIERYQERQAAGTASPEEAVALSTRESLGPVVGAMAAVAVAVLPIVVLGPVAGLELLHPMAVALLGGLVSTTVLSLFILPALYLARATTPEEPAEYDPLAEPADTPVGSGSRT